MSPTFPPVIPTKQLLHNLMTSRRTQLRSAIVSRLRTAISSLGRRVYSGRLMPIEQPQLPAEFLEVLA